MGPNSFYGAFRHDDTTKESQVLQLACGFGQCDHIKSESSGSGVCCDPEAFYGVDTISEDRQKTDELGTNSDDSSGRVWLSPKVKGDGTKAFL